MARRKLEVDFGNDDIDVDVDAMMMSVKERQPLSQCKPLKTCQESRVVLGGLKQVEEFDA
jgi:hypothetical protein